MYNSIGSINPLFGYISSMGEGDNAKATATELIIGYLSTHLHQAPRLLEEQRGEQTVVFAAVARNMTHLVLTIIDAFPTVLDQRDTISGNTLFLHAVKHANDVLVTRILQKDPRRVNEKNMRMQSAEALIPKTPRAAVNKITEALKDAHATLVSQAAGLSAPQPSAPPYPEAAALNPVFALSAQTTTVDQQPTPYRLPFYRPPLQQAPDVFLDQDQYAPADQEGALGFRALPEEPASIQEMPDGPS